MYGVRTADARTYASAYESPRVKTAAPWSCLAYTAQGRGFPSTYCVPSSWTTRWGGMLAVAHVKCGVHGAVKQHVKVLYVLDWRLPRLRERIMESPKRRCGLYIDEFDEVGMEFDRDGMQRSVVTPGGSCKSCGPCGIECRRDLLSTSEVHTYYGGISK